MLAKKKILIFSLFYFPDFVGGAEVSLKEITSRIASNDCEFHMITLATDPQLPREETVGNVRVYRVGVRSGRKSTPMSLTPSLRVGKIFFPLFAFFRAQALHRKENYDVVWSMMANQSGFAGLFFKLAHSSVPFLLSLQEGDPISKIKQKVACWYPLFKMIFTRANAIQTISHYLADFARSMGARADPVVVPNGVDIEEFKNQKSKIKIEELKAKILGVPVTERTKLDALRLLITTSRLVEKNAVGDIISAMQFLPEDVKLLIIGAGPLEKDLKLQATLSSKAKLATGQASYPQGSRISYGAGGLQTRIMFLGYITHNDLINYLHISDVFVRPSLSEGMGNSFIEAMAAGLPVIGTAVGGIVDFLKDKETGLFCAVKDPQDIARKVTILLCDEAIRSHVVNNAQKLVAEKYDWTFIAKEMRSIFEKIPS